MPNPFIDHSLIDSLAGTIADEAVAEAVPAFDDFPIAIFERVLEMVRGLVGRKWIFFVSFLACGAKNGVWVAECEWRARMILDPRA